MGESVSSLWLFNIPQSSTILKHTPSLTFVRATQRRRYGRLKFPDVFWPESLRLLPIMMPTCISLDVRRQPRGGSWLGTRWFACVIQMCLEPETSAFVFRDKCVSVNINFWDIYSAWNSLRAVRVAMDSPHGSECLREISVKSACAVPSSPPWQTQNWARKLFSQIHFTI